MKVAKYISMVGILAMSVVLLYGFIVGDFFNDGGKILSNPWGIVSLVDLYVGFSLFSIWIFVREENKLTRLCWIVGMMVLGFFTGSLYVLYAIVQSKGDKEVLFFGRKRVKNER